MRSFQNSHCFSALDEETTLTRTRRAVEVRPQHSIAALHQHAAAQALLGCPWDHPSSSLHVPASLRLDPKEDQHTQEARICGQSVKVEFSD